MKLLYPILILLQVCFLLGGCKILPSNSAKLDQLSKDMESVAGSCFQFEYVNKLISLSAGINKGGKEYSFILDSGAPTLVTDSLVLQNNLKYITSKEAIDANGNIQAFDIYKLKQLSINGSVIHDVKVISNDLVDEIPAVKGKATGGLLGANIMENSVWTIDYQNKQISISNKPDSLCIPANAMVTKMFRNSDGNPMIEAVLSNKKKLNLMVDLGYNGSVLLPSNVMNSSIFSDTISITKDQKVSTAFQSEQQGLNYKYIKEFKTGSLITPNVESSSTGRNDQALLGNAFLENYTIVMDFIKNRLIFIPAQPVCSTPVC